MIRSEVWLRIDELSPKWLDHLRSHFPKINFVQVTDEEVDPAWLEHVNIVFTDIHLPSAMVDRMPNLRWVQFTRGGASHLGSVGLVKSRAIITVTRGIHGAQFAEFALACVLSFAKRIPEYMRLSPERVWQENLEVVEVSGLTLGVLGLGAIGTEVAKKAKAFGMKTLGIKRSLTPKPDFVDELWHTERIDDLLSQSDFLVIALPADPQSAGILTLKRLRKMKPSAYIINLTQEDAFTENDLVHALRHRWIAGAAIDALGVAPIAPESPLWHFPNVIITPRIGGRSQWRWKRLIACFSTNLDHFLKEQELDYVVDKAHLQVFDREE